jgi:hypothetical protein
MNRQTRALAGLELGQPAPLPGQLGRPGVLAGPHRAQRLGQTAPTS